METGMLGVFLAFDCFLFYIFWEIALIPIYFISSIYGGQERIKITLKFFIYTILGSLFMLIAIIYLYTKSSYSNKLFLFENLIQLNLSESEQMWIFAAFFLAFAIKIPIFPLHTWQPDTYTVSPSIGTMLLSGIMLKMGIFGFLRWALPVVPIGFNNFSDLGLLLSVIGVVYASIIALKQENLKRLVAYSSITHVGLISAGIFTGEKLAIQGIIIQMINHGINVVGMFMILDIMENRLQTMNIKELGGIAQKAPILATVSLIIILANVALPLTNSFVGEFLLLYGIFKYNMWAALFAGLTMILGAAYGLTIYQKAILGQVSEKTKNFKDLTFTECIYLAPIIFLIFIIGIYPNFILSISESSVNTIIGFLSK
jgi:NADH-quinone oxidoreductase subunit M